MEMLTSLSWLNSSTVIRTLPWLSTRWTEDLEERQGITRKCLTPLFTQVAEHGVYSLPWIHQIILKRERRISTYINICCVFFQINNQPGFLATPTTICFFELSHHRCPSWVWNHGTGPGFLLGSMGSLPFAGEEPPHLFCHCHPKNTACHPHTKALACPWHCHCYALNIHGGRLSWKVVKKPSREGGKQVETTLPFDSPKEHMSVELYRLN